MTKAVIGIQARSTSTRLPNKISEFIGRKTMLAHVIDSCNKAARYLNNWNSKNILVEVAVLIPENDPIKSRVSSDVSIIEGPENDVLSRYVTAGRQSDADYICRVTADCPLIPHYVISKMLTLAVMNAYDYVSNVDERCRTAPDGVDCEVFSKIALEYLDKNAFGTHREHVTTLIRERNPEFLSQGCVVNFFDLSKTKLSVDTDEDLARVRKEDEQVTKAYEKAVKLFGRQCVHRF